MSSSRFETASQSRQSVEFYLTMFASEKPDRTAERNAREDREGHGSEAIEGPALPTHVFVTGIGRSGTTLVDRLISCHPEAWIASQPLPLLYVELKRAFLRRAGRDMEGAAASTPLADLFGDNSVDPVAFRHFVGSTSLSRDFVERVLEMMDGYSGRYFVPPSLRSVLKVYSPSRLVDCVDQYLKATGDRPIPRVIGSKETWCEEYIWNYLDAGARVVWVVRDPRDVFVSLHHGKGPTYAGLPRPALFVIRQWRKSVALALDNADDYRLTAVRYEDLVQRPFETMEKIGEGVGIRDLGDHACGEFVPDSDGREWKANSSFQNHIHGIDPSGVGRFVRFLSPDIDRFFQATCFPEMSVLGYELEIDADTVPEILQREIKEDSLRRPELEDYRWSRARSAEEQRRWARFCDGEFSLRDCLSRGAFQLMTEDLHRTAKR